MEVSTLMTLALFLNLFPVFGLHLPFTWLAVFLIPFSWHWLGVPDLMGFYKQDILWKVKRKNMTWALWEFSIQSVFWCSRCWWNRQCLFPHALLTFPYPHAGWWSRVSVSPSPPDTHAWVTDAGMRFFSVPDILCVNHMSFAQVDTQVCWLLGWVRICLPHECEISSWS